MTTAALAPDRRSLGRALVAALLLPVVSFAVFAQVPLLEGHCMKNVGLIEAATHLGRDLDPSDIRLDYAVTLANPRGRIAPLWVHETPLSLAALALLLRGSAASALGERELVARLFALAHALLALGLAVRWLHGLRHRAALWFALLAGASFTTMYFAARPLAETFALPYQMFFLLALGRARRAEGVAAKVALLVGAALLLCVGGKMNYFFVAAPAVLLWPWLDASLASGSRRRWYLGSIAALCGVVLAVLFSSGYPLSAMLAFLARGNFAAEASPVLTFLRGFFYLPKVVAYGLWLAGPLVVGSAAWALTQAWRSWRKQPRPTAPLEVAQLDLAVLVLGHALNYVALRNLYVPHDYYQLPGFFVGAMLAALAFTELEIKAAAPRRWQVAAVLVTVGLLGARVVERRLRGAEGPTRRASAAAAREQTDDDELLVGSDVCAAFYAERRLFLNPPASEAGRLRAAGVRYWLGTPPVEWLPALESVPPTAGLFRLREPLSGASAEPLR